MAKFKIVLSDPETGKVQKIELEEARAVLLIGRKIGEIIDGTILGLPGHKIQITGGTDKDGLPLLTLRSFNKRVCGSLRSPKLSWATLHTRQTLSEMAIERFKTNLILRRFNDVGK